MRAHVRWLHAQLPALVEHGVLTPEAADRLRAHYGAHDALEAGQVGRVVVGVLGATLVGAGVILLLASNWDALGRPARAAIAVGVLVVAQALAAFALWRRPASVAWREATGAALVLAVGASTALVSQTFHLQGDVADFLWVWIALSLPVPYVLDASFPAVLVAAGIAAWPTVASGRAQPWMLVGLLALAPRIALVARDPDPARRDEVLGWAAVIALLATIVALGDIRGPWMLLPASLFGALAASAAVAPGPAWSRPARIAGTVGGAVLAISLSWGEAWPTSSDLGPDTVLALTIAASLGLGSLGGAAWLAARGRIAEAVAPSLPLVVAVGWLIAVTVDNVAAALWVDLVVGAGSLLAAWLGLRDGHRGRTNAGLATFSALVVVRFFDGRVPMLVRGVVFITIGVAFLVVNARLLADRREAR